MTHFAKGNLGVNDVFGAVGGCHELLAPLGAG